MNSKKVLYISYDGLCEPLGQSQVLSYMSQLSSQWNIEIISFEKPHDLKNEEKMSFVQNLCKENNIVWKPLRYHKRMSVLSTAYDIISAWVHIFKRYKKDPYSLVHCRSYVATAMGMPLRLLAKRPLIFDMRGFWADEKLDSGQWEKGVLYKLVKLLESVFIKKSTHIISLTSRAVEEILSWPRMKSIDPNKFSVISTCVSTDSFTWSQSQPEQLVVGYIGGAQLWYDFPRALGLFNALLVRYPAAKLHIVNKSEHEYIRSCLSFAEVPMENVVLEEREHQDMASVYAQFSIGVFFIKNFYSKKASMPTKLAEFLASGVPVVTGVGIGDVDHYLNKHSVGVLVRDDVSDKDLSQINSLLADPGVRSRCRNLAESEFSLKKATEKLNGLYRHLSNQA